MDEQFPGQGPYICEIKAAWTAAGAIHATAECRIQFLAAFELPLGRIVHRLRQKATEKPDNIDRMHKEGGDKVEDVRFQRDGPHAHLHATVYAS